MAASNLAEILGNATEEDMQSISAEIKRLDGEIEKIMLQKRALTSIRKCIFMRLHGAEFRAKRKNARKGAEQPPVPGTVDHTVRLRIIAKVLHNKGAMKLEHLSQDCGVGPTDLAYLLKGKEFSQRPDGNWELTNKGRRELLGF